jgi:GxxExxY protein
LEQKELSEKIIACAYRVYNTMGAGFLESVYEKCLAHELHKTGLPVETQKAIKVRYDGELVGEFIADLIVNDTIILGLKAIKQLAKIHEVQLVNYLVATGKPVGLLINFGEDKIEIKRKLRTLK